MSLSSFPFSGAAALLAGAAMILLAGCQVSDGAPAAGSERASLLVDVRPAERSSAYRVRREFIGRVEARRASDLGFELAGELDAVRVEEGDEVAAGQRLASLDTARLEAALAEAEAALAEARSASELAARTLARNEEALAFEGVSAQEVDLARDRAASAAARAAAAEARINAVRVDIEKSTLIAPYAAVVVARRADEGQVVGAGQPVLGLQELAAPEVRLGVAGDLAQSLAVGDAQRVIVNGVGMAGRIQAVLPLRDPRTRTVDVIVALDPQAAALPGDLARLVVDEVVEEPGFWLPADAIAEGRRGLWTAYVVEPLAAGAHSATGATHRIEPRAVEVLQQSGNDVYVRGALEAGALYVTSGLQRIVPEQAVRISVPLTLATGRGAGDE